MKFNKNNQQKSFGLLTFLGFLAIATSIVTTATKPLAKNQDVTATTEQQSEKQERQKPLEPIIGRGNDETLEEIHLDQEWEDILGDDPEQEVLLARGV